MATMRSVVAFFLAVVLLPFENWQAIFSWLPFSNIRDFPCFAEAFSAPGKALFQPINEVLPQDYYKRVYDVDKNDLKNQNNDEASSTFKPQIPWDVGGPQPTVVAKAAKGIFNGKRVLDCGCGAGENALYIAQHCSNCHVTAFDLSAKAVELARQEITPGINAVINEKDNGIEFHAASCLALDEAPFVENQKADVLFDVALDSACLHCLSEDDAVKYARDLAKYVKERRMV